MLINTTGIAVGTNKHNSQLCESYFWVDVCVFVLKVSKTIKITKYSYKLIVRFICVPSLSEVK